MSDVFVLGVMLFITSLCCLGCSILFWLLFNRCKCVNCTHDCNCLFKRFLSNNCSKHCNQD